MESTSIGAIKEPVANQGLATNEASSSAAARKCFPVRYQLVFARFIAFICTYATMKCMNVTVLVMVEPYANNNTIYQNTNGLTYESSTCKDVNSSVKSLSLTTPSIGASSTLTQDRFHWTDMQITLLLSSYYLGKALVQLPSVLFCRRLGARLVMGTAVALTGVLNLLLPVAAKSNIALAYTIRAMQGGLLGAFFTSSMTFYESWTPAAEKSVIMALNMVG